MQPIEKEEEISWRTQFVEFCMQWEVLKFGEFQLKSGRKSPYFFNAGLFNSGSALRKLGEFYAKALIEAIEGHRIFLGKTGPAAKQLEGCVIFGPAYKGIPLSVATTSALDALYGVDVGCTFNRKVAKDHGEGGRMVGADLKGKKVILVDDVITAGTAIRESVEMLRYEGCTIAGVLLAMDRQEVAPGASGMSAIQQVEAAFGFPVVGIICLDDIVAYMEAGKENNKSELVESMNAYRREYGVIKKTRGIATALGCSGS